MADDGEPVVVYTGAKVAAGFLKGLLENAGLQVFVWGEGTRAGFGSPLNPDRMFGASVVVARRNLAKAQPIVKEFLAQKLFDEGHPFGMATKKIGK